MPLKTSKDVIRLLILKQPARYRNHSGQNGKNKNNNDLHLKTMTLFEIYELLMEYTHQYTRMMNTGVRGKAFKECEEMILKLQEEINERRKTSERRS